MPSILACKAVDPVKCRYHGAHRQPHLMSYDDAVKLLDKAIYDRDHSEFGSKVDFIALVDEAQSNVDSTEAGFQRLNSIFDTIDYSFEGGIKHKLKGRISKALARRSAVASWGQGYSLDFDKAAEAWENASWVERNKFSQSKKVYHVIKVSEPKDDGTLPRWGVLFLYRSNTEPIAQVDIFLDDCAGMYSLISLVKDYLNENPKIA